MQSGTTCHRPSVAPVEGPRCWEVTKFISRCEPYSFAIPARGMVEAWRWGRDPPEVKASWEGEIGTPKVWPALIPALRVGPARGPHKGSTVVSCWQRHEVASRPCEWLRTLGVGQPRWQWKDFRAPSYALEEAKRSEPTVSSLTSGRHDGYSDIAAGVWKLSPMYISGMQHPSSGFSHHGIREPFELIRVNWDSVYASTEIRLPCD